MAQMGRGESLFWNIVGGWAGQSLASVLGGILGARVVSEFLTREPVVVAALTGLVVLFVLAAYRRWIGSRGPALSVAYDPTGLVMRKLQRFETLIDLHSGDALGRLLLLREVGTHFLLNRPIESRVSINSQMDHLDLWQKMVEEVIGTPDDDETKKALKRFQVLGV